MAHQLDVFQSMWAMKLRSPDGTEWSMDRKVEMVCEAKYKGIDLISTPFYAEERDRWLKRVKDTDLDLTFLTFPSRTDRLEPTLELADKYRDRVRFINMIPRVMPVDVNECADLLKGWLELGREADIPVYLELHRACMTQDLIFYIGTDGCRARSSNGCGSISCHGESGVDLPSNDG